MEFELGRVIAERSLEATDDSGDRVDIRIKLGNPVNFPDSPDVCVPYQIDADEWTRLFYASGVDGFQALQLALKMIMIDIESYERKHGFKVVWGKDLI